MLRVSSILAAISLAAATALAVPAAAAVGPCTLQSLEWMAGEWRGAGDRNGGEERWVVMPGGALMGSNWLAPRKGKGFAETMTVAAGADGGVVMRLRHFDLGLTHAWEERDAPMVFALTECGEGRAVFAGVGARTGERLTYQLDGARLTVTGDFIHDGNPSRAVFPMVRAGR